MCGICGMIDFSGKAVDVSRLEAMTDILSHRGPDGRGVLCRGNVGLGHRRLAIIDLTSAGRQPMSNADETVWIVFNGEIYNFKELRAELTKRGYDFRSNSDTEVIIHGYEEWGVSCWEKLDGMFAFALWDSRKQQLFLVRDPFAIKPLYWSRRHNMVIFGSEIKSILISGEVERNLNHGSLYDYLTYFYTPGPETMIQNVYHVKPGRAIAFDKNGAKEQRFWRLKIGDSLKAVRPDDLSVMLREESQEAVRKSLVSDVPVGLLLSSGLDSNIILNEVLALGYRDIQTITVGFRESSFDETSVVRKRVRDTGVKNHMLYVEDHDLRGVFDHMVYHMDSLNANVANLAEYLIVKTASKYAKVVLAGGGNDELFAGYATYIADQMRPYYLMMPRVIRNLVKKWAYQLPRTDRKYSFDYLLRKFTDGAEYPPHKSHYWWRTIFTDADKESLLAGGNFLCGPGKDSFSVYKAYYDETGEDIDFGTQNLYADFFLFCNENANMMVDNLSMAFSLEVRPPFLTKRFVEFAFSVPYKFKLKGTSTKYCLREAYRKYLPGYITKQKKSGLVSPLSQLIRGPMKEMIYDAFSNTSDFPYFNRAYLKQILGEHMSGKNDHGFHIYLLFTFMRWYSLFIKTDKFAGQVEVRT